MHQHTAFIFDLDGTLLDTLPDLVTLTNTVLVECGYPQRLPEEILSFVGNGAYALMLQAVPKGTTEHDAQVALARWKELYPELGHAKTAPYPGIPEALEVLRGRGIALGVLSNKFDAATREVIERCFPGVFDAVHGECELFPRKPDPQGMLHTIAELGATPQTSVYVGDSPGDIQAAHNAGAFGLAVSWGYRSVADIEQESPEAIIDHPAQLLDYLTLP